MLLFCISCKSVVLKLAGIKRPQIESGESIINFLKEFKLDTNNVFCLDTSLYNQLCSHPFKPGWKPGFRPVQIRCYDKHGNPVMQWVSCEGSLDQLKTFDSVPPKNAGGLDTSLTLASDLARFFTLDGKPAGIRPDEGYDYYFLVFFAKYFPRMTRKSFREVSDYAQRHPELNMTVYKINTDVMDFWGDSLKLDVEMH